MEFEVYIYGNSVGRARIKLTTNGFEITWDKEALRAVNNIQKHDSCCASMIELFKGAHSFATFGDGVGELKVV